MKKNTNTTDRRIASILKSEAPVPPSKEWFTRKALNRLPDKQPRIVSLPEIIASAVVIIVSGVIIALQTKTMLDTGDPASCNPQLLGAAAAMAICATLYISVPVFRRC